MTDNLFKDTVKYFWVNPEFLSKQIEMMVCKMLQEMKQWSMEEVSSNRVDDMCFLNLIL